MNNFEQQLQNVISEQYGEIEKLYAQIAEMQLLIDKANEELEEACIDYGIANTSKSDEYDYSGMLESAFASGVEWVLKRIKEAQK